MSAAFSIRTSWMFSMARPARGLAVRVLLSARGCSVSVGGCSGWDPDAALMVF